MHKLLLLLSVISLTACSSLKDHYLNKYCISHSDTIFKTDTFIKHTRDTIHIYYEDTIKVQGQLTSKDSTPLHINPFHQHKKTSGGELDVNIDSVGKVIAYANCDSLQLVVDSLVKIINNKTEINKETVKEGSTHIPFIIWLVVAMFSGLAVSVFLSKR